MVKENDPRFAHIQSDPRFKKIGKKSQKVKIDNRFAHMFTDDKFTSVDFLDKRGKKEKEVSKEKLERFYDLEDEDKDDEDKDDEDKDDEDKDDETPSASVAAGDDVEEEEEESEDDEEDEEGEPTDSSDDESSEEEDDLINNMDAWDQVHDKEIEEIEESTCRLSICNLNWDRMNASDIYVLLDSFIKSKGTISKVEVFPSQYGLQKIEEERMKGPDITPVETEEEEFNEAALRKYQIERLKYYYAIVTTDAPDTADTLYSGLDGIEYQLSSSHLDLRYVPHDMDFSEQSPSSVCTELPNMATYQPPKFITSALQNSSVKLTWDETEQSRLRLTTRKFDEKELEGVDFSAYLASSESESEGEGGEGGEINMEKYKALLAGDEDEEDEVDQEMEITWTTGLEDNTGIMDEAQKNEERQSVATHYKPDDKDDFFATDEVVDRPKEKKKKTKKKKGMKEEETKEAAELALLMQDGETEKKHFNMKKILKNKGKEDDFSVDLSDDRFSALKTSHLYSIDPTAPEYKETANTNALRIAQNASTNERLSVKSQDPKQPIKPLDSTMSLVDKIKGKSANFTNKKSKLYSTKTVDSADEPKSKKSKRSNVDDSVTGEFVKPKKSKKNKVEEETSEFVKPKKLKKKKVKPLKEGT